MSTSHLFAQNGLFFNELTSRNGLDVTKVVFVQKDSRGFAWVGTLGGLFRYDGIDVAFYGEEQGLSEEYLQSQMLEDQQGYLWFCAYTRLFCYDPIQDTILTFGELKAPGNAKSLADYGLICVDKHNQLWLTAGEKLFSINLQKTLHKKELAYSLYSTGDQVIAGKRFVPLFNPQQEFNGFLEYYAFGPGMKVWKRKSAQNFEARAFFDGRVPKSPVSLVYQILPQKKSNQYWVFTDLGIFDVDIAKGMYLSEPFNIEPGASIFNSVPLNQDNLLCCTEKGLFRFNIQSHLFTEVINWSSELNLSIISKNSFRQLFLDRENILWAFSYDEGLGFAQPQSVKAEFQKLDVRLNCLLSIGKNDVLIGTNDGLFLVNKNGQKRVLIADETIMSIYKGKTDDDLWAVGVENIYKFDKATHKFKNFAHDIKQTILWEIFRSSDGTMWLGSTRALKILNEQTGAISAAPIAATLQGSNNFFEDIPNQRLYMQENANLLHIFQYKKNRWSKLDSFLLKGEIGGYLLPKGSQYLWIASAKGIKLVNRTNSSEQRQLELPPNWPKSAITGLVQDKQGLIWASTSTHLLCFSPQGKPLRIYNYQEGLFAAPFQYKSLKISENGVLIVGGKNGVSWFQPAQMQHLSNKPKIQLTHCLIQGRPFSEVFPADSSITEKKYLRLKYRQNTFHFQVTGIEMGMPQDVKIQYYLRNWEDHRQTSLYNQTTEARYEKLAPGTYQLRVRAASANGQWIPWQTKLTIQIIPPIWMRWWFIALVIFSCIGVLILSVQSYYRAQLRDAQVRNDEQERILRDIHDLTSGKIVFFQDFKGFAQTQIPQLEVKNKALDIAEQALQLFKRISVAVRNSLESDSTLLEFLTQIVAESRKILDSKVIFSAQLAPSIPYAWVSGETKKQLRFVVQEVLGNILKHAEANKVSLTLAVKEGKLNITIQDDGKGIPEEVITTIRPSVKIQAEGNGLGITLGRMLNLGGTIKWVNDHGTKVFIAISLQKVRPKRNFFSTLLH